MLDVTDANRASVMQSWVEHAADAGLTRAADLGDIRRWVLSEGEVLESARRAGGVVELLDARGVSMPPGLAFDIEAKLAASAAGDMLQQCTSAACVSIIYMGQSPGVAWAEWYVGMRAGLSGLTGMPATIAVRTSPGYRDLAKTSNPTLHRALLDRTGHEFLSYKERVNGLLQGHALPQAAARFTQLCDYAIAQYGWNARELTRFLQIYFFVVHEGLGMPLAGEDCHRTDKRMQRQESAAVPVLLPLDAAEARVYEAQAAAAQAALPGGVLAQSAPWGGSFVAAAPAASHQALDARLSSLESAMGRIVDVFEASSALGGAPKDVRFRELTSAGAACALCRKKGHSIEECPEALRAGKALARENQVAAKARKDAEAAAKAAANEG